LFPVTARSEVPVLVLRRRRPPITYADPDPEKAWFSSAFGDNADGGW